MSEIPIIAADMQEKEIVLTLCEAFRQAFVATGLDMSDPQNASFGMAAGATFAGILFGGLIPVGVVSRQDQRRFVETMSKNLRSGVNIGEMNANRIASEMGLIQ